MLYTILNFSNLSHISPMLNAKSIFLHATSLLNLSYKSPVRVQQEGGVLPILDHLWSNHAGSQVLCLHLFSSQFHFFELELKPAHCTMAVHVGTGREGREDPISLSEFMDFIKIVVGKNKGKQKKFSCFAKTMQFLLSILDMVLFSSFDRLFLG